MGPLQELPEGQRADAVSSMVYEAGARIRDPIYGCTGAICLLQKQVEELQAELARAQAELLNLQAQHKSLIGALQLLPPPLDASPIFADHDVVVAEPWDDLLGTIWIFLLVEINNIGVIIIFVFGETNLI